MDEVFSALDDPSRRKLLDALFEEDGRTLSALCDLLPQMTRFGVMNHLRILEGAGLITTQKLGRSKHHYLNPVPIRLAHDRWISKYTESVVTRMVAVKSRAEGDPMSQPTHVYKMYIAAPVEEVWKAITDGDVTVQYFYGTRVASGWSPGDEIVYTYPDGTVAADGEVLACDPPHRVEMLFHARWDPEIEAEGPVREVWQVEDADGASLLSVEMWDIAPDSKTLREFSGGLAYILSGMKTLLETGKPLTVG
jgi:uncharacterized protein YndB with AHSA1/START domain